MQVIRPGEYVRISTSQLTSVDSQAVTNLTAELSFCFSLSIRTGRAVAAAETFDERRLDEVGLDTEVDVFNSCNNAATIVALSRRRLKQFHHRFCCAMLCKRSLYCHLVSVCLSVCLSHAYILSKRINISSKFSSLSGSHTILVFPYQTAWQ